MYSKKQGKRPRKRGRRSFQARASGWVQPLRTIRYPILPENFRCRLRYQVNESQTVSTSAYRFGLAQFWNQLPAYFNELMAIWRMCRIVNISLTCTVNPGASQTAPFTALCAVVPASEYPLSYSSLGRLTTSKRAIASGIGGMDKLVLRASYSTNRMLGVSALTERGYQQSAAEAAATTALIADTPVVQILICQYNGSNVVATFNTIVVDYDIQFFELQNPGI